MYAAFGIQGTTSDSSTLAGVGEGQDDDLGLVVIVMNDIDWQRLAAAVALAVILERVALDICILVDIPEPYRSVINTPIGIAAVFGFYRTRKHKSREGVPMED